MPSVRQYGRRVSLKSFLLNPATWGRPQHGALPARCTRGGLDPLPRLACPIAHAASGAANGRSGSNRPTTLLSFLVPLKSGLVAFQVLARESSQAATVGTVPLKPRLRLDGPILRRKVHNGGSPSVQEHSQQLSARAGGAGRRGAASAAERTGGIGSSFARWYLRQLEAKPIVTKSVTAASIFIVADLSSQGLSRAFLPGASEDGAPPPAWDLARTARMAAVGLFLSGPTLHLWFNFMARLLPAQTVRNSLAKMALGQALYGPAFNAIFFSLNAAAQGETQQEIMARLKRDLLPTLKRGLLYWPPCDIVTYRFVPVALQVATLPFSNHPPPLH